MLRSLLLALAGLSVASAAAATAQEALVAFDGLCVGTDGNLQAIGRMAAAAEAKELPATALNQDPAIARDGGKGYAFKRGNFRFIVMATPTGACSLLFKDVSPVELQRLVETNYQLTKPYVEASGPQTNTVYRITGASAYSGGRIMLTVAKPGFGSDNLVSLGFMPAAKAVKPSAAQQR